MTYQTRFTNGQGSENQTMRSTAEEPANQDNEEIKVGKESVLKKMLIRDIGYSQAYEDCVTLLEEVERENVR